MTVTVNAYEEKGWHYVELTWEPTIAEVDIYRDSNLIAPGADGGSYLDRKIAKGGATYVYEVCPAGLQVGCVEPPVTVNF